MSQKKSSRPVDLAKLLKPIRVKIRPLGTIELDMATAGYIRWLEEGEGRRRWQDGVAFTRDLVQDRTRNVDAPDPELQAARALTREQAEVAAREILKAAAPLLAPRKFIDPKTRKLREFRADDLDPLELIEGESSCERLYRLARSKLAYHQARSREMLEQLKVEQGLRGLAFPSDRLAVLAKATSAYDRVLRDIARPYSTLGRSPSLRSFE
jgi:hypothetical protein